jgi:hypothetical protein
VLSAVRLPGRLDAAALEAEVAGLPDDAWVPHFNTAYYEGDWSGVALRSVGGAPAQIYPDPAASEPFADTALLGRCPALAAALAGLECELLAARLLRLGPGARIREHRDHKLGYEDGELRLHAPITTNPGVEFLLEGRPVEMAPGELWYLDLNLPHAVANRGAEARVHLVVDCVVGPWLSAQLEAGARSVSCATGRSPPGR